MSLLQSVLTHFHPIASEGRERSAQKNEFSFIVSRITPMLKESLRAISFVCWAHTAQQTGALQGRKIGTEAGRGVVKHRTNGAGELTGGKGFFNEV